MKAAFRIDVHEVEGLASRVAQFGDGQRLGVAALEAVNAVAVDFKEKAIQGELANINLPDAYVRSKTDLKLGTNYAQPRAELTTAGDLTVLGRFPGTTWYRQPGASRRAGPVKGQRSAGVYANITNADRLNEPQWFVMRLRNQGSLLGVFVRSSTIAPKNDHGPGLGDAGRRRDGKAGKRHVYGPSPYALFRKQIDVQGPELERDLERTVMTRVLEEIDKVL